MALGRRSKLSQSGCPRRGARRRAAAASYPK